MNEADFIEWFEDFVNQGQEIFEDTDDWIADDVRDIANKIDRMKTFEDAMLLTRDKGIVVKFKSGEEFQLTVQRSA